MKKTKEKTRKETQTMRTGFQTTTTSRTRARDGVAGNTNINPI